MEYARPKAGEWIRPEPNEPYHMECCGCGLVHRIEFEVVSDSLWRVFLLQFLKPLVSLCMFRDEEATVARRQVRALDKHD